MAHTNKQTDRQIKTSTHKIKHIESQYYLTTRLTLRSDDLFMSAAKVFLIRIRIEVRLLAVNTDVGALQVDLVHVCENRGDAPSTLKLGTL